jgi:peroxiredoxin
MTHAEITKLKVDAPTMPRWVPRLLNAAAIYNILCGAFVVLFPTLPFRLAGMQLPNYPAIVQCLGMVIGVYGVGYALAARNPVERWPLVLVGLLGKVLGPVGFVYAAWTGELPWQVGLMIVTNDLVWWLPFTAILLHAVRIRDSRRSDVGDMTLADLLRQAPDRHGVSLYDCSQGHDLLVVCVRHSGCTYCREALDDLARQRSAIGKAGARLVVVHMGSRAEGEAMLQRYGCEDFDQISDPDRRIYRALQLRLGTLTELFGIRAFWRALIEGTIFRFGFGRIVGNGLQMPGAFLIRNGEVVKAYRHESSADRPDYADMACSLR